PVTRRFQFAATDVFCSVKNLPLQIGEIDTVEIDKPEGSNASACQVKRSRRTQTAGADAQNARCLESLLSLRRYFGHNEMTRIALQFFGAQLHRVAALVIDDASLHTVGLF